VIASLNTGALGPAQQEALQRTIDQRILAIDRIASTTRFGDLNLLNGNLAFNVTNASPQLSNINVTTVNAAGPLPLNVNITVTAAATQASATGTIAAAPQVGDVTFRVQGNIGSQDITLAAGATQADVVAAINAVKDFTGVEATAGGQIVSSKVGCPGSSNGTGAGVGTNATQPEVEAAGALPAPPHTPPPSAID
jgi:flagellin-like hook-associated protein FlgL